MKNLMRPGFALLVFLFQIVLAGAALAQVDRAVLEGTITDPSGGSIAGANVQISSIETGLSQEQHANTNGYYRFPGLAVGRYKVTVSNNSFKTKIVNDVVLDVGQTRTLDLRLEVGIISEK